MGLVYTWFDHTQGKRPLEIVFSSRIRVKWNTGRRGIEQTELEMTVNRREIQYFYGPNIESVTALTGEVAAEKTRICQRVFEAFWYAEKIQPAGTGLI